MRTWIAAALVSLCLMPGPSIAQQPARAIDDEEKMDDVLRTFGYVSGQAFQCQPKDQQTRLERTALDVANNILRLFGSDRAFYFAAAFGAGAAEKTDPKACADVVKRSQEMQAKLKALTTR